MSLTTDGATLYSGGAEGVLVVWHNICTSSSTGASKSFFPRLGCPISFLANNSRYSVFVASLRVLWGYEVDCALLNVEFRVISIIYRRNLHWIYLFSSCDTLFPIFL